jgi:hypothetical protein
VLVTAQHPRSNTRLVPYVPCRFAPGASARTTGTLHPNLLHLNCSAGATRTLKDVVIDPTFGRQDMIDPLPGPDVVFGGEPMKLPPCKSAFEVLLAYNLTTARELLQVTRRPPVVALATRTRTMPLRAPCGHAWSALVSVCMALQWSSTRAGWSRRQRGCAVQPTQHNHRLCAHR